LLFPTHYLSFLSISVDSLVTSISLPIWPLLARNNVATLFKLVSDDQKTGKGSFLEIPPCNLVRLHIMARVWYSDSYTGCCFLQNQQFARWTAGGHPKKNYPKSNAQKHLRSTGPGQGLFDLMLVQLSDREFFFTQFYVGGGVAGYLADGYEITPVNALKGSFGQHGFQ
jgi:hypothetical protein